MYKIKIEWRAISKIVVFTFFACGVLSRPAYAGFSVYIDSPQDSSHTPANGLYQCPSGGDIPKEIPAACEYDPGVEGTARYRNKNEGACVYNQRLKVKIERLVGGNLEEVKELENQLVHASFYLKEKIFTLPMDPGVYVLHAVVEKENGFFHCSGDDAYRWFKIKEPSVSPIAAEINEIEGGGVNFSYQQQNKTYYIPYSRTTPFNFITKVTNNNADLNNLKSCSVWVASTDVQTGKVKDNDSVITARDNDPVGHRLIHPQFIKPGERISINSSCKLDGKNYPEKNAPNEPEIFIARNKPDFGRPHFTLGIDNDGSTTSPASPDKVTPIDWQSDVKYTIGVAFDQTQLVKPESCDYNGTTVNARSEMLTPDAKKNTKDYEKYTFSQSYSGSCYIGRDNNSPYKAYPYSESINNSFTLTRKAPRITNKDGFNGSGFGVVQPDGETDKLRPGDNVQVSVNAKLNGDFPHAEVRISPDSHLLSQTCPAGSQGSGAGCVFRIAPDGSSSGTWVLKANKEMMERTTTFLGMSGDNHELNEESGNLSIAGKKITITPIITVGGQLDAIDQAALAKKVFHYGREFTVAMNYQLLGKTPQGTPNTAYEGTLTGLMVQAKNGLLAGTVSSSSASIVVDKTPTAVNTGWKGDSFQGFVSGQPALRHDQVIHLQVPVKVEQQTRGTANIDVLGLFTPANVDIDSSSPTLLAKTIPIALGDKLLPAEDVYKATVNASKPLVVSQDVRNSVLTVEFGSQLKAAALMTGVISGTEMTIALPKELSRSSDGDSQLVLLCDGEDCSTKLNNEWNGGSEVTVLKGFTLDPNVAYQLKVPVTLKENATSAMDSQVKVTLSQSQQLVDQDTRERVITWVENSTPSTLVVSKALKLETRGPVTLLPLTVGDELRAGSATLTDRDTYNLSVNIVGALAGKDQVTLTADGKQYKMKPSEVTAKDGVAYVAENLAIPNKPDYPLSITFHPSVGADQTKPLMGSDSPYSDDLRMLTCSVSKRKNISRTSCTLHWGGSQGAPVPFISADALLSIQALDKAGVLKGITLMDLMKNLNRFNSKSTTWNSAVLFKQSDWKTAFPTPNFKPTNSPDSSIMGKEKEPLPIKGEYTFGN